MCITVPCSQYMPDTKSTKSPAQSDAAHNLGLDSTAFSAKLLISAVFTSNDHPPHADSPPVDLYVSTPYF